MRKRSKIINIAITLSIIILIILSLNVKVYAENEVENTNTNIGVNTTTNTGPETKKENTTTEVATNDTKKNTSTTPESTTTKSNSSSSSSSTPTSNKKATETKKSSNANLSNLGINPNDFKGFKAQTTTYNVTVPTDVESVTIYANAQDSKAKVSGVGKQNLQTGANKFDIVVTAEDGTTKTYTLNITRDESSKNTENVQERYTGDGLASLNIENLELNPKFDTGTYEYSVKYFGEKEKIDINATATDPYYIVEITGNEKLVEGENTINILVSDPDGNNVATYQITVNKALVDEEAIAREKQEQTKKIILIGAGIALAIILIIIIIVIVKKRRNMEYDYYEEDEEIEEENNQLEDYDRDMNYIEEKKKISKEDARKEFLDNYNKKVSKKLEKEINIDDVEKKNKNRGKRFK